MRMVEVHQGCKDKVEEGEICAQMTVERRKGWMNKRQKRVRLTYGWWGGAGSSPRYTR